MSEETPSPLQTGPTELELLKQRANMMGITHSNNISVETLRQKINDKMAGNQEEPVQPQQTNPFEVAKNEEAISIVQAELNPTKAERKLTLREHLRREHMKLVRVRITCLDPKKKDLPGEVLTVANEHIGTVRKFVPYGEFTDEGYHLPWCLYTFMKNRKFTSVTTKTDRITGQITVNTRDVAEFSLDILDPLTEQELHDLAVAQLAAGSVD